MIAIIPDFIYNINKLILISFQRGVALGFALKQSRQFVDAISIGFVDMISCSARPLPMMAEVFLFYPDRSANTDREKEKFLYRRLGYGCYITNGIRMGTFDTCRP
jgi:hypothetical protein